MATCAKAFAGRWSSTSTCLYLRLSFQQRHDFGVLTHRVCRARRSGEAGRPNRQWLPVAITIVSRGCMLRIFVAVATVGRPRLAQETIDLLADQTRQPDGILAV